MKRKSAPQIEWEKAKPWREVLPYGPLRVRLTRRQFNALCQKFYRRGMERAAGVAENARTLHDPQRHKSSEEVAGFVAGRDAAAKRIRSFINDGAKDE